MMLSPRRLFSGLRRRAKMVSPGGIRQRLDLIESRMAELSRHLEEAARLAREQLALERKRRLVGLQAFERRVYSQNGEDGILEEILRRIGVSGRFFVEFGVETGAECNCARLAREENWSGLFMEADPVLFVALAESYRVLPAVRCVHAIISSDNIEQLLADNGVPEEFGVLSIDIDGNDYWVRKAIRRWGPQVVVIEYNASHPPERRWVMAENPSHRGDGTDYYGASLRSLATLGQEKGYTLVGTDSVGVNAFFVRSDLATLERFPDPSVAYHYTPPRFGKYQNGHPPGRGPFVAV
jgi:hypothetical protein